MIQSLGRPIFIEPMRTRCSIRCTLRRGRNFALPALNYPPNSRRGRMRDLSILLASVIVASGAATGIAWAAEPAPFPWTGAAAKAAAARHTTAGANPDQKAATAKVTPPWKRRRGCQARP